MTLSFLKRERERERHGEKKREHRKKNRQTVKDRNGIYAEMGITQKRI